VIVSVAMLMEVMYQGSTVPGVMTLAWVVMVEEVVMVELRVVPGAMLMEMT
jgi:hypothetical protein